MLPELGRGYSTVQYDTVQFPPGIGGQPHQRDLARPPERHGVPAVVQYCTFVFTVSLLAAISILRPGEVGDVEPDLLLLCPVRQRPL